MKKLFLILFLLTCTIQVIESQQTKIASPKEAVQMVKDQHAVAQDLGRVLFEPVSNDTPPKPDPYSILSINEQSVENFYGKRGLNVDEQLLNDIKKFYFYFEYATKLELAAKLIIFAQNKGIDPIELLEKSSWNGFVDKMIKQQGSWYDILTSLTEIDTPAYKTIEGSVQFDSWEQLPKTAFWSKITVTQDILGQSSFWQKYLKYSITKTFDQTNSVLDAVVEAERRLFMYIPSINIAYYNQDFNNIRNSAEFFRVQLLLYEALQERYLAQCLDWKNITLPNTQDPNLVEIYKKSIEFKKTPFYSLVAPADDDFISLAKKLINNENILGNRDYAQEPLAHTELTIIAMIFNLQARLHYLFDNQHLDKTMKILGNTAIKRPEPDILWYQKTDKPFLEDINTITDRFKKFAQKTEFKDTTPGTDQTQAQVQGFTHFVKHVGREIKHAYKSATETKAGHAVSHWVTKKLIDPRVQEWKKFKKDTLDKSAGKNCLAIIKKSSKTFLSCLSSSLKKWDAWKDLKKSGEKLGQDVAKASVKEGLSIYRGTEGVGILISGNKKKAAKLFEKSKDLQNEASDKFQQVSKDTHKVMKDTINLADKSTYIATAYTVGAALTVIAADADLGEATSRALAAAVAIGAVQLSMFGIIAFDIGEITLTPEILSRVASIVETTVSDLVKGKAPWADLRDQFGSLVKSLVNEVSAIGTMTIEYFKDFVKTMAYVITMITDVLLDAAVAVVRVAELAAAPFGESKAVAQVATEIRAHKRTAIQLVTTAVLIGAAAASGGMAIPVIAMMMGPQMFFVGGGYQDDEAAKTKKAAQKEFLANYQTFVNNNKIISQNAQKTFLRELKAKFGDQINNQERELGFYQNMLSNYLELSTEQLSYSVGGFLAPQLQVEPRSELRFADIGALYGFKTGGKNTGLLNLNPSQGFPLYNKARGTFSQEIAVYPAPSMQMGTEELTSDVITKFWFNQKETYVSDQSIADIDVRWRILYVLNTFHIGLYFGGKSLNIADILKTKKAPVDAAHLAKMLVYVKEEKEDKIELKLYEHEGTGWFKDKITSPAFTIGVWYRIKASLSGSNLKIKIWKEEEPEPTNWQSFSVKPTEQKTVGMISSGASIEYEFITPAIPIQAQENIRKPITWPTEIERTRDTLSSLGQESSPQIGSFKLNAIDQKALLKNQFVYSIKNGQITDIVILGTKDKSQPMQNIGASPRLSLEENELLMNAPNVAIASLVSGNIYDKKKTIIGHNPTLLEKFEKEHGTLSASIRNLITQQKKEYIEQIVGPFNFGKIRLSAVSQKDLGQGIFIYKAVSPEAVLRNNGQPIKNQQGNEVYDYFMIIDTQGLLGAPYSPNASQIESLVTGNVYERDSLTPVQTGFITGSRAVSEYAPHAAQLSPDLAKRIDIAAQFYQQKTAQPQGTKTTRALGQPTLGQAAKPPAREEKPRVKPVPVVKTDELTKPAEQSLEKRSAQAAAGQEAWGA